MSDPVLLDPYLLGQGTLSYNSDEEDDGDTTLDRQGSVLGQTVGLSICTVDTLHLQPQERLVQVLRTLARTDPTMGRKIEETLMQLVLRDQMVRESQQEKDGVVTAFLKTAMKRYGLQGPEDSLGNVEALAQSSQFDVLEVEAMQRQWQQDLGETERLSAEAFAETCHTWSLVPSADSNHVLCRTVLRGFDRVGADGVTFEDFVQGLSSLCRGKPRTKVSQTFALLDVGQTGFIEVGDLRTMFSTLAGAEVRIRTRGDEEAAQIASKKMEEVADRLFAALDVTKEGRVSYTEFVDTAEPLLDRQRKLNAFAFQFNRKPAAAIAELHAEPVDVVPLLSLGALNKQKLGEYLGSLDADRAGILAAFTASVSLEGSVFGALQRFTALFRLPGEAQCIDRIMEAFAKEFVKQHPDHQPPFRGGSDTVFVLAFAVVMLSTDAHNRSVKEKMTADQFVGNLRGIDAGGDLDREYAVQLYHEVQRCPLRLAWDTTPVAVTMVLAIASCVLPDVKEHKLDSNGDAARAAATDEGVGAPGPA